MKQGASLEKAIRFASLGNYEEALRVGKIILKDNPNSPNALSLCGSCAANSGDLPLAAKYYSKFVKLVPRDAEHWSRLALARFSMGDYTGAGRAFAEASKLKPDNAEYVLNAALSHVGAGNNEMAFDLFARALDMDPGNRRALQGLANVRFEQSRPFEAMPYLQRLKKTTGNVDMAFWVEYAERALSVTDIPGTRFALWQAGKSEVRDPDLEARMALVWNQLGKSDEAVESIERARAAAPGSPDILNEAATIYRETGRSETALQLYRELISRWPDFSNAWIGLCQLVRFKPDRAGDTALVEQMEAALRRTPSDPALVHFALGKACGDLDDIDRSFAHLKTGNGLRRQERPYSLKSDGELAKVMKQRFPPGSIGGRPYPVSGGRLSPVFIVGMPRSGTTLVEQIVGAHPEVMPCGELMLLPYIMQSRFWTLGREPSLHDWTGMGDLYRRQVAGLAESRRRTTDKLPLNFFNVGVIWTSMPDARVIFLRRNPYATGLSCYRTPFSPGLDFAYDLETIARFQLLYDDLCMHWKSVAPERFFEVCYEDLVQDVEAGTKEILAYCGLEWHPDCAHYYEETRRIGTASFNQANRPVYTSSLDKWRRYEKHLAPMAQLLN